MSLKQILESVAIAMAIAVVMYSNMQDARAEVASQVVVSRDHR